jgi:hypothetical protein
VRGKNTTLTAVLLTILLVFTSLPVSALTGTVNSFNNTLASTFSDLPLNTEVKTDIDQQQRDFYLRQQLKTIQEALGEDSEQEEAKKLREAAKKKKFPEHVKDVLEKELQRLERPRFVEARRPGGPLDGSPSRDSGAQGVHRHGGRRQAAQDVDHGVRHRRGGQMEIFAPVAGPQELGYLAERAVLDELADRIPAIQQTTVGAVDQGQRGFAGGWPCCGDLRTLPVGAVVVRLGDDTTLVFDLETGEPRPDLHASVVGDIGDRLITDTLAVQFGHNEMSFHHRDGAGVQLRRATGWIVTPDPLVVALENELVGLDLVAPG